MYKYIFSNLDPAVYNCQVQICRYEDLDQMQMNQGIGQPEWGQWDIQTIAENGATVYHAQEFEIVSMTSDTDSDFDISSIYSIESINTIGYDITSDMIVECDINLDSLNEPSVNEIPALPDIDTVMAELNVLGGDQSPPTDFIMPEDYYPASPIYSPTSPAEQSVQSPSMSPTNSTITINNNTDTESEHGFTPAQNDGPIVTRGDGIFTLAPDDSDTDLDRDYELINLMSSYLNRNRMPLQINGVYIFPQENNVHNLEWVEYQDEPCTDHCVIPQRTDKSFAKFYLTHSLCLKHRSNLTSLGPWVYLTNKVSTLTKIHNCPQITHFIVMVNSTIRRDQRVRHYLVASHLSENNGSFTLLVRIDVYMENNPTVYKYWTQTYCVNDHVLFGEKTVYYLQRNVNDIIMDLHVNR